jgi:basic membrane protein A
VTLYGYAGSFAGLRKARCRNVALDQIAKGSGVVFQVAGACGLGALEAARDKGVYGIGADIDQSSLGPHVLTSVLKRIDVAVYEAIRTAAEGRFRGGRTVELGLREGAVGLGKISPRVPRPLVARMEKVQQLIVSGAISGIPSSLEKATP